MKIFNSIIALLITITAIAQPGSWKHIGKEGDWANTISAAQVGNNLYSIEESGRLYVTDAPSGVWKEIGQVVYGTTAFMYAANGMIYTIETTGSLYATNPADGSWKQVGKTGAWIGTKTGTILNGKLYTVEKTGALYVTNLSTGAWLMVGKAEFGNTWRLWAANNKLYSIETSGSLYEINPNSGAWKQIGEAGAWKNTINGVVMNDILYSVEQSGAFYATDLSTGKWVQLGKADFAATKFMGAGTDKIYTIETSGNLYEVNVR